MSWDKKLVRELKEKGLSHEHAMICVGLVAELNQQAYMQGYNRRHLEEYDNPDE